MIESHTINVQLTIYIIMVHEFMSTVWVQAPLKKLNTEKVHAVY